MLKIKRLLSIKNRDFNRYLNSVITDYTTSVIQRYESIVLNAYYIYFYYYNDFKCSLHKSITFRYDNIDIDYVIKKEVNTDTWILVCDTLVVLYIKQKDIDEFCSLYENSDVYNFVLYKYNLDYIAFCTSHTINDIDDPTHFYLINNTNEKYLILSYLVNSEGDSLTTKAFVILNKTIMNYIYKSQSCIKHQKKYHHYDFYCNLGYGSINVVIHKFIKLILQYVKMFQYHPPNYLVL